MAMKRYWGWLSFKTVSSVLSHVLCCLTIVIALGLSVKLTHVEPHSAPGCFGESKERLQGSWGYSSGRREDSSGQRQDLAEMVHSASDIQEKYKSLQALLGLQCFLLHVGCELGPFYLYVKRWVNPQDWTGWGRPGTWQHEVMCVKSPAAVFSFLSQDLCTCCALCSECHLPNAAPPCLVNSYISFESQTKYGFTKENPPQFQVPFLQSVFFLSNLNLCYYVNSAL